MSNNKNLIAELDTRVDSPEAQVDRDRWGHPLILDPETGKCTAYTRASTFGSAVEDMFSIHQWERRIDAVGFAQRPDLVLSAAANIENKTELGKIVQQAKEAGRGSAAATEGTARHKLAELHDRGETLRVMPEEARVDIDAWRKATAGLTHLCIEAFTVCDEVRAAGTPDRISCLATDADIAYVVDLKTGNTIDLGALKIAAQMAIYSRGKLYDPRTGERRDYPVPVSQGWGLVAHLPAGQGTCELRWIDLHAGWHVVQVAAEVRKWRRHKIWYKPFSEIAGAEAVPDFSAEVAAAVSVAELRDVYRRAAAVDAYDDALHVACLARKAEINGDGS